VVHNLVLRRCYRCNAEVTSCLRMVVYRDVLNDAVALAHLTKKRVVDVVVEITERYFLRQNCTNVVRVVLKTFAQKYAKICTRETEKKFSLTKWYCTNFFKQFYHTQTHFQITLLEKKQNKGL